ncbi:at hook motif family protein [Ophiostoma piceae UAMH 11346]|uniref:At hook motif family protein n=1 Tax=Ophiostoma piceae (strain UAMH 11346) TaxID=1262450 RepID=S3D2Y9_OPHP1|nr:at hook motif family protein [Ophiostoma piceae UAMH 11346]
MDVPTPPPIVPPEPIRRNGFQFDGAFKTIDGVAFERPQHLLRLCYPSEPEKWKIKLGRGRPPKMEKITDLEAARTLSRKFMLAQFRFYGIPPPYQSSSDEVLGIFQEQVTQGNFRKMAADVEALRDEMAAEWEKRKDNTAQRPRGRPKGSTRKNDDALPASIVGEYHITSKEIQDQWSVNGNLALHIAATSTTGVFKGTFHFGVILGVMILSADEKQLIAHVRRLDAGDDPDRRNADDLSAGGKRKQPPNGAVRRGDMQQLVGGKKARTGGPQPTVGGPGLAPIGGMPGMGGIPGMPGMGAPNMGANMGITGLGALVGNPMGMTGTPTGHTVTHTPDLVPPTPASPVLLHTGSRPPLKFYVRWRGRGLINDHLQTGEHRGTFKFTNKHYTKFSGEMDLAFLGADEIVGKRISSVPTLSGEAWSDYMETVYDWRSGNRWN